MLAGPPLCFANRSGGCGHRSPSFSSLVCSIPNIWHRRGAVLDRPLGRSTRPRASNRSQAGSLTTPAACQLNFKLGLNKSATYINPSWLGLERANPVAGNRRVGPLTPALVCSQPPDLDLAANQGSTLPISQGRQQRAKARQWTRQKQECVLVCVHGARLDEGDSSLSLCRRTRRPCCNAHDDTIDSGLEGDLGHALLLLSSFSPREDSPGTQGDTRCPRHGGGGEDVPPTTTGPLGRLQATTPWRQPSLPLRST